MARENKGANRASAADPADTAVSDVAGAAPSATVPDAAVVPASGADQPAVAVETEGQTSPPEAGGDPSAVMPEFAARLKDALSEELDKHRMFPEGVTLGLPDLEVTARVHSRCRAGRRFGLAPVTIPAAEVTEALLKALGDDPLLKVVPVFRPVDQPDTP